MRLWVFMLTMSVVHCTHRDMSIFVRSDQACSRDAVTARQRLDHRSHNVGSRLFSHVWLTVSPQAGIPIERWGGLVMFETTFSSTAQFRTPDRVLDSLYSFMEEQSIVFSAVLTCWRVQSWLFCVRVWGFPLFSFCYRKIWVIDIVLDFRENSDALNILVIARCLRIICTLSELCRQWQTFPTDRCSSVGYRFTGLNAFMVPLNHTTVRSAVTFGWRKT